MARARRTSKPWGHGKHDVSGTAELVRARTLGIEATLGHPDRPGREERALEVKPAHNNSHTFVLATNAVRSRYPKVIKNQLGRLAAAEALFDQLLSNGKSGGIGFNYEGRNAV